MKAAIGQCGWFLIAGIGSNVCWPVCRVLVHFMSRMAPGGLKKRSPREACLEGSNAVADGGAILDCLMKVKNAVRNAHFVTCPRGPCISHMSHKANRREGVMGSLCIGV